MQNSRNTEKIAKICREEKEWPGKDLVINIASRVSDKFYSLEEKETTLPSFFSKIPTLNSVSCQNMKRVIARNF